MQTFRVGDLVSVLHDTITGTITEVGSVSVTISDEDGFSRSYPLHKIALRQSHKDYKIDAEIIHKDLPKHTIAPEKVKDKFEPKLEIDLHIEELREYTTHLTNYEIVQIQMTACRAFVQDALKAKLKEVVVIHGKGEGVLKSEIHQYLDRLSNNHGVRVDYSDAPFNKYGIGGATSIIFYGEN